MSEWVGLGAAWTSLVLAAQGLVIAQAVPEPYGLAAQYGLAGALGVLLIRRYDSELQRERAARERADAQRDVLTERIVTDIVPLATEVQRTMVPTLDRLSAEVRAMREQLDQHGVGR